MAMISIELIDLSSCRMIDDDERHQDDDGVLGRSVFMFT
jgi:hypothetical protein